MAIVKLDDTHLKNIADVIRARQSTTETYKPKDMATAIVSIGTSSNERVNSILCKTITEAIFPNVTFVKKQAFTHCTALTKVCFASAETLEYYVFDGCTSLETVELPSVKSIDTGCFRGCSAMTALILRGNTVCSLGGPICGYDYNTGASENVPTFYIYVPAALIAEYQAGEWWANVASKFRAIEDYPEITGG